MSISGENTIRSADTRSSWHSCNGCLSALSADVLALLKPHLTEAYQPAGTILWEQGAAPRQTYFPVSGMVSIVVPMQNGASIEVGSIAREGAAGLFDAINTGGATTHGVVQIGGVFTQVATAKLLELAVQNRQLADLVRYCRAWLLIQAQQLAACNGLHDADKRLCRWLTHCQQRLESTQIQATQESIGVLLGLRRTTVTLIAQSLHTEGIIDYSRGKITVRDVAKLEAEACECCLHLSRPQWPSTQLATANLAKRLA